MTFGPRGCCGTSSRTSSHRLAATLKPFLEASESILASTATMFGIPPTKMTKRTNTSANIIPHSTTRRSRAHCGQIGNPVVRFEGVKSRKVEMERPGQREKSNSGTGGNAALWRVITRTASYPYHTPNETDILIPTRSSAICGCEEGRITVSYHAAGRQGSRALNRHVIRPLSYIRENAKSCIKSNFGNGLFLLLCSSSTYGQFPFITFTLKTISFTSLQPHGYSTEGVC